MKPAKRVAAGAIAVALAGGGYLAVDPPALLRWQGASNAQAPDVAYTLLDGTQMNTSQLRGKVVLVSFWATSCATCVHEMPEIAATHEKYKARGYETLAVAMRYDPPVYVARFAESRRLPFGVAIDNTGQIARSFGDVELTPTSVLIDKHGRIARRYVGAPDFAALRGLVERLLVEG